MTKFLLISSLLLTLTSSSFCDWQAKWIDAVEHCQKRDWEPAEESFSKAISELKIAKNEKHPHVYVDRARLYLLEGKYLEALDDLDLAFESPHLKGKDRLRALVSRISALANLELLERLEVDSMTFHELTKDSQPQIEMSEGSIVIRNMPDCDCYTDVMTMFLLQSGMAEKKEDIKVLDSNICIVKRAKNKTCCQECKDGNKLKKYVVGDDDPIANATECHSWCRRGQIFGNAWCIKIFKQMHCQLGCMVVIDEIVSWCNWCCDGEKGFYERCIAPFDHLAEYIFKMPCDPAWD